MTYAIAKRKLSRRCDPSTSRVSASMLDLHPTDKMELIVSRGYLKGR